MYKLFMPLLGMLSFFSLNAYAHGGHIPLAGIGHALLHFEYMLPTAFVVVVLSFWVYKKRKAK